MPSPAALPSSAPWRRDQHPGAFSFASGGLSPFAADRLADRDAPLGHRHSCMHPAWRLPCRLPTAGQSASALSLEPTRRRPFIVCCACTLHFPAMLFFIIISQLLNVPEIRNGSGNHSWKPSLVYSATRVFRSSARVW
jgi:hypothetical protein